MNSNKLAILIGLLILPLSALAAGLEAVEFDHADGSILYFKAPSGISAPDPMKTALHELTYVGKLGAGEGKVPYFIFTGKTCANCMEDKGVHILRPDGSRPSTIVFPGKIFDPKTRALLWDGRSYWGKCLPKHGEIFVTFQQERIDRRRSLQRSVFIAEPGEFHLIENLIERSGRRGNAMPKEEATKSFVRYRQCHKLDGRNRLMLSKPLDLRPHTNDDKDDDDDDRSDEDKPDGEADNSAQPANGAPTPGAVPVPAATH